MDGLIKDKINICEITRREVERYVARGINETLYAVLDDKHYHYGVVAVPKNAEDRPAMVVNFARVEGDYIIIEEDTAFDKPLHEALMVNGNIPREQIILAYKGETIPEKTEES